MDKKLPETRVLNRDSQDEPRIDLAKLNPVENNWQFMRDNWLSNRVFTSYTNIVDHCCYAWNKLVDQPWLIMSIGTRQWATRSYS